MIWFESDPDQIKEVMPDHTDNWAPTWFRLEIEEAGPGSDFNEDWRTLIVLELWKPGQPVKRTERA